MKKLVIVLAAAVGLTAGASARTWDLTDMAQWTSMPTTGLADGDVAVGKQPDNVKLPLKIADGATVTLRDATVNKQGSTESACAGVMCEGDATIVLEGVNVVKGFSSVYPGVFVPPNKTLTIKGTGTLSTGPSGMAWSAGIGGGLGRPCGNIVIEGGTIFAQAVFRGAGIGAGGGGGSCGNITIKGGVVVANGGWGLKIEDDDFCEGGAGIGGGDQSNCGNIVIEGGSVSANGRASASGIGSSTKNCGKITISGGTVTARGGEGAGIGGGIGGCGDITIGGGTVNATGGANAAGIGCGQNGACGDVKIRSGVDSVMATHGANCENSVGAGVGGTCTSVVIDSALSRMTDGKTLFLGKIFDLGRISGDVTIFNGATITGTLGAEHKISIDADAKVTLRNVKISGTDDSAFKWAGLTCLGSATLVLEGENKVNGFYYTYPGIYVPAGKTLTIQGDGILGAASNGAGAGIGAGWAIPCGNIDIRGGTIVAQGGQYAAGIGGAFKADNGRIDIRVGIKSVMSTCGVGDAQPIGRGEDGVSGGIVVQDGLTSLVDGKTRRIAPEVGNLAVVTENTTYSDGAVLTGTLGGNYKISIADGATVTLSGATINGVHVNDAVCMWAGLTCEGDATIILEGKNTVKGFHRYYPGIHVPSGKTLTILGSGSLDVSSSGNDRSGAGIGGGHMIDCGNIVIEGGSITATGGECAAGIGSGDGNKTVSGHSACGDISILGGTVVAVGGYAYSAGIGAGRCGTCGNITIGENVVSVVATSGDANYSKQPIGKPTDQATCGTITVAEGLSDVTSGNTRTILSGDLSTIREDTTFGGGAVLTGKGPVSYKVSIADGATVTLRDVRIEGDIRVFSYWAGLTCEGDATIILEGENYICGFNDYPGIVVPEGKTLTIKGNGFLTAESAKQGAGIGSGGTSDATCGNIVIESGHVVAKGGTSCAGIGSSYNGDCGNITIKGGYVEAYGGEYGAGIGGALYDKSYGHITISGGVVYATGGKDAAGIGSGRSGACGAISIEAGVALVAATCAGLCENPIGAGYDASSGEVTVASGLSDTTSGSTRTIKSVPASTVTFGKNGGTGGSDSVTAVKGQAMPAATAPTRSGYIFEGYWTTTGAGGVQYYDGAMKGVRNWDKTSDTTLWAKWRKAAVVKVTLSKNGGTGGDSYVTCTEGQPMPTPRTAPTQSGWTFAGYWDSVALDANGNPTGKQYYDASMKSVRNWDKTSATTLWAKWTNKVTLGKNGGTGGDNYVTCTKGQPMPKRTMPMKSGYVFDGYWTTTGAGGVKYYNSDGTSAHAWDKSGSVTLWAKWVKPVACKVTFGKNGGTGGDNYVTATTGKPMPTPRTAPKLSGWTFAGYWDTLAQDANGNPTGKQYYDKDMKSVRAWDKTSDATLWAKWTVRVKLGKNGGTGGDDYVTVTYNQPFPKRTMPTRSGYTFGGYWVSASSKTGQCYNADGTGTSSMKWSTGGTPTIWALWTKTSSCVEVATADTTAPNASAAPAAAELAAIPAGLYSGVLADGTGIFWLVLDEEEKNAPRTAFLYVASEDGSLTAECTVEELDGILLLTTEDGEVYAFDPVACSLVGI